jgi:hypothetical protein
MPRQVWFTTIVLILLALGMSFYLWELRGHEKKQQPSETESQHVAPPIAGPMEQATIWVADDSTAMLHQQTVMIPASGERQQRAEELLDKLTELYTSKVSPHPLQAGAEVREVFLVNPGTVVINLNSAYVGGQVSGVLPEELTIASLIQTLATNIPGLTRVKILVDGKERDTLAGHADLSGFYDVGQVNDLAKQLSSQ